MRAIDAMSQEQADHSGAIQRHVRKALDDSMRHSERSTYAMKNMIGVSDIGGCREFVRRAIVNEPFSDDQEDYAAAFIGTAVGALAEQALIDHLSEDEWPGLRTQVSVEVTLTIRGYTITIPGHPDVVVGNEVWDFKTVDGLGVTRRVGPSTKQWYQVMLYCKALIDAGEVDQAQAWVTLIFIDRSGAEAEPLVFSREYDPAVVEEAEQWMDDVIYAVQMDEEASRDQPRSWCEACCPRYTACRQPDTDVQGVIDDPVIRNAAEVYRAALAAEKLAAKDKASAKSALANVSGVVWTDEGPMTLRWVDINPTEIPATQRAGYRKIDLRPMKLPKGTVRREGESSGGDAGSGG